MNDTEISRVVRINIIGVSKVPVWFNESVKFPSSVNKRWPATMLATNRMDSVIGRIKFLVISIRTIKFMSGRGVPSGTR
jgi:hypothetical protein